MLIKINTWEPAGNVPVLLMGINLPHFPAAMMLLLMVVIFERFAGTLVISQNPLNGVVEPAPQATFPVT